MNSSRNNLNSIEQAFQSNNRFILEKLYVEGFSKVKNYVMKNNGTQQDAKDVCQDAFMVLWKKASRLEGNFKTESEASGFLYQVAKNKWLDELGSSRVKKRNSIENMDFSEEPQNDENIYNEQLGKMKKSFNMLGEQCRELLQMFYYRRKNMNEIGNEMNLDEASARNKKYRCMKKLKELALQSN